MKRCIGALVVVSVAILARSLPAAEQRARTEDGREVILRDDGTWVYANEPKPDESKLPPGTFKKDPKALVQYKGKRGTFRLSLVPGTWSESKEHSSEDSEAEFAHKDGDVYALVIHERVAMSMKGLRNVAIANARNVDKDLKVRKEERRVVNGREVLCITFDVNADGIPCTFFGYYYTGREGSFQILTWTGQNLFKEMKPDMEAFLNGFEVTEKKEQ